MTTYIALLRGINVGGNNKIKMADLKQELVKLGYTNVQTYIQSGNIVLTSNESENELRDRLEAMIAEAFKLSIKVVIRNADELKKIVADCPFTDEQIVQADGASEFQSLYVTMLLGMPVQEKVDKLKHVEAPGEQFVIRGRDVYLLFDQSVRNSKLSIQMDKLGTTATTRNWKTMNKLVAMADEITSG